MLSNTTRRYLTVLRMWHVLHDVAFPPVNDHRIQLLLKASKKTESSPVSKRAGFTLMDIHRLINHLKGSTISELVLRGLILVGFWGLARLGELTLSVDHPNVFIRRKDVSFASDGSRAKILIRMAKTAAPGKYQFLHLSRQPNVLDPITALKAILDNIHGLADDPLFPDPDLSGPIRRSTVISQFKNVEPRAGSTLLGHSLRI